MTLLDPYFRLRPNGETAFSVEGNAIKFGPGVLTEIGGDAKAFGLRRVLLVTDSRIRGLPLFQTAHDALTGAGVEVVVFDEVVVEPTDTAISRAAQAAIEAGVDGFVSLGGGSVMDTAKAANLLSTWPAPFLDYVNAPLGRALPPPGPLKPHIACTTTFGTAAETTGIAIFDLAEKGVKTGILGRALRPSLGVADPLALDYLPIPVLASNGFDVLSHAIESYTARPFTARARPDASSPRPQNQGANPFSSLACLEAIRLTARNLERAIGDSTDRDARAALMFAGLLAGIGFGNSGNHLPHALSYPVAHHVRQWRAEGWPQDHALIPHGIAVALNAPASFRHAGPTAPQRFQDVLHALGGASAGEAGEAVASEFIRLMRNTGLPSGLAAVGYGAADVQLLAAEAFEQKRLIDNAPSPVTVDDLEQIYRSALRYW